MNRWISIFWTESSTLSPHRTRTPYRCQCTQCIRARGRYVSLSVSVWMCVRVYACYKCRQCMHLFDKIKFNPFLSLAVEIPLHRYHTISYHMYRIYTTNAYAFLYIGQQYTNKNCQSDLPSNLVVMKWCMCCCSSLPMPSPTHECYLMGSRFPAIPVVDFPDWAMPHETRFPSRHHSTLNLNIDRYFVVVVVVVVYDIEVRWWYGKKQGKGIRQTSEARVEEEKKNDRNKIIISECELRTSSQEEKQVSNM